LEIIVKPVYVLAGTPGATDTVAWTDICHGKDFVYVDYQPVRWPSRWATVVNKRPFFVHLRGPKGLSSFQQSSHRTLVAAIRAANKAAKVLP
jgi:hypothetical protein